MKGGKSMMDREIKYMTSYNYIMLDFPITEEVFVSITLKNKDLDRPDLADGEIKVFEADMDVTDLLFDQQGKNDIRCTTDNLVNVIRIVDEYLNLNNNLNQIEKGNDD
jgi:hypothetical protein